MRSPSQRSGTSVIDHPDLGAVRLRVSPVARRASARWSQGRPLVIVPPGLTSARIAGIIDAFAPHLLKIAPPRLFSDGTTIDMPLIRFRIGRQSISPGKIIAMSDVSGEAGPRPSVSILPASDLDIDDPSVAGEISRIMANIAAAKAGKALLMRAAKIASELGAAPASLSVSSGRRTLGSCSRSGAICLSRYLLFTPLELTDYVIRHELAHLSHHDHSAAFHTLLDRYCGGQKASLEKRLKTYVWPILR